MSQIQYLQRQRELEFFNSFIKSTDIEVNSIQQPKSGPPDLVIVDKQGKTIGIEIRELYSCVKIKKANALFQKIIKVSKQHFDSICTKEINVSFQFTQSSNRLNKDIKSVGAEIAKIVLAHIVEFNQNDKYSLEIYQPLPDFPELIKLKLIKCDCLSHSGWHLHTEVAFGTRINEENLLHAINEKIAKINNWNSSFEYHAKWLLLVETGEPSSIFSSYLENEFELSTFYDFDRIYIMDNFILETVLLKM